MSERGSRAGWTFGGLGSLLWILIFGAVLAARGNGLEGLFCLGLFGAGAGYLTVFAPWKHRETPLWKPYLGFILFLCLACVALFFAVHDVVPAEGERLNPWLLLLLLPLFTPVFTFGRKTWNDLHGGG